MKLLIFMFKSGLQPEEVREASEERAEQFRKVTGLLQKYYVHDKETNRFGGVYVFDSEESLKAFRDSELAQSTSEAYRFTEQPSIQVLDISHQLRK